MPFRCLALYKPISKNKQLNIRVVLIFLRIFISRLALSGTPGFANAALSNGLHNPAKVTEDYINHWSSLELEMILDGSDLDLVILA